MWAQRCSAAKCSCDRKYGLSAGSLQTPWRWCPGSSCSICSGCERTQPPQFTRILVLTPSWSIFSASSATERSPTVPPVWEERPLSEDWSRWKQISRRRFSSDRMIPITETAVIRIHGDQGPQGVQMLLTVYSMEADRCRKQINNANSKTNTKMQKKKKNAATAENRSK